MTSATKSPWPASETLWPRIARAAPKLLDSKKPGLSISAQFSIIANISMADTVTISIITAIAIHVTKTVTISIITNITITITISIVTASIIHITQTITSSISTNIAIT